MSLFVVFHLEQSESDVRFLKFNNTKVKESIGSISHLTHYKNEGADMPLVMSIISFCYSSSGKFQYLLMQERV